MGKERLPKAMLRPASSVDADHVRREAAARALVEAGGDPSPWLRIMLEQQFPDDPAAARLRERMLQDVGSQMNRSS